MPPNASGRERKLVSLTLVIWFTTVISVPLELIQGTWQSGLGNASVALAASLTLLGLRAGVSVRVVTPFLLVVGLADAAFIAIGSGPGGILSIVWMTTAPLIAMSVGGRRAGWVTLAFSMTAVAITLVGIDQHWLPETVLIERSLASRGFGVLAFCLVIFLLTRAYELETEASIARLREQNEALLATRIEAEQANRAKSDFLATMSHEIRTPLNGVTSMVLLLRGERDANRLEEGLQVIESSADMLRAVISDVLDFSKIESAQLELERIPVAVGAELQAVVRVLEPGAAERGTTLELERGPSVPEWIQGDPTRLRQIMTNLVGNAVKFTEGGSVRCRLFAEREMLSFEVSDTGLGMTRETVARLFRPFMQGDSTTTRKFGGTGLGLVITRRLVEAMGGQISVESERGRGSRFTVTLPFVLAPAPHTEALDGVSTSPPRRVLLVEDNLVNQMVARKLLEKLGHEVTLAGDGQQAIEACAEGTFDLVLMDCHMPVMDGFEATRRLRSAGFRKPIVALTAAVSNEDRDHCLNSGMSSVLSKPLRLDRLAEVLAEAGPSKAA
jgi:signal transduction histidine kinase/CheY-like chemotaxis protein